MDRLGADPDLHVYHYAPYEPTAFRRLMGRYATREVEVDRLLRGGVLVDLYRVVRQGVRASVESYSIKKLEPHYGYEREVDLRDAGSSIVAFEEWLELGGEAGDQERDARAHRALQPRRRRLDAGSCATGSRIGDAELAARAGWTRSAAPGPSDPDERQGRPRGVAPAGPGGRRPADRRACRRTSRHDRTPTEHARWLLAQLLGWHRRENKAGWWRYFHLLDDLTDEERVEEAEPIGMLELVGVGGRVRRYDVPIPLPGAGARHSRSAGEDPIDPRQAPASNVELDRRGPREIVLAHIKAGRRSIPRSLVPDGIVVPDASRSGACCASASAVVDARASTATGRFRGRRDLLCASTRASARTPGEPCVAPGASRRTPPGGWRSSSIDSDAADPGTTRERQDVDRGRMVLDLVAAGRRVGVTANGHKVIGNLLDEVCAGRCARTPVRRPRVRIGQKPGDGRATTCRHAVEYKDNGTCAGRHQGRRGRRRGRHGVDLGARGVRGHGGRAVRRRGRAVLARERHRGLAGGASLVLLGDPQQLDQPIQGTHPPGAERSALAQSCIDGQRSTMPPERGLFLETHVAAASRHRRVHLRGVLRGKLAAGAGQRAAGAGGSRRLDGAGIRFAPVPTRRTRRHRRRPRRRRRSRRSVASCCARGAAWIDRDGDERC